MVSEYFSEARDLFRKFRLGLESDPSILDEFLKAVGMVVSEYNTTIRENRFLVGGTIERLIAVTMRCLDIRDAQARGLVDTAEDIMIGNTRFSIKSSFTKQRSEIRLVNTLGDSPTLWSVPTIFVLANRGIGYADPALLPDAATKKRDAVVLPRKPLDQMHDDHPMWLLPCAVPTKESDPAQNRAASVAVAAEVLRRTSSGQPVFPRLSQCL